MFGIESQKTQRLESKSLKFKEQYTIKTLFQIYNFLANDDIESETLKSEQIEESKKTHDKKGSFCVMLHAGLKSENLAAIVCLGDEWYGSINFFQENKLENKHKSYLMLSIFVPGLYFILFYRKNWSSPQA